jgi:hypothetical protein
MNREPPLAGVKRQVATTTLSVKQALDQHGREALISLFDETGQMVTKKVFHPVTWEMLPSDQRKRVLRSLMFVKRKRSGKLKSRFCVDGRPQKVFGNGDHSSPTAASSYQQRSMHNPYDQCVFNAVRKGKKCTVVVYVDDLKISHVDPGVIDEVKAGLVKRYQTLTEKTGPKFDYLGMEMDYSTPGEVSVTMEESERDAWTPYATEVNEKTAVTPAANNLFAPSNGKTLGDEEAELFHSTVATLLYIAKRARPDILTVVSMLTTKVQKPRESDRVKLMRVLKYLKNSEPGKALKLRPESLTRVEAFVDASFAVYPDYIGVTGGIIKVGGSTVYCQSSKQKLCAKSSTEAEIIGVADALGQALWVRNFLLCQGLVLEPVMLWQDNQSAIWMHSEGYKSSKRTRHMNIKYFFVRNRIENHEVQVAYLSTEKMVADLFTKPLQGSRYRMLMGQVLASMGIDVQG